MKNLLKLFVVFVALGSVFTGCKKDDDDSSSQNYFKVGDTQYELSAGAILGWEETSKKGVFYVDLALHSSGISYSGDQLTGKGDVLYFQMYSTSLTDLPVGTYSFANESLMQAGTFFQADALISFDSVSEASKSIENFKDGNVAIKKNGNEYDITVTGTSSTGKTITGYYKGALTKY